MIHGVDFIGICVNYLCHDGKGRFLFNKRSQEARDERERWDCGGGKLEFGKTVVENLQQEIQEEYCADVLEYEFLGYRDVFREYEGKKTHWLAVDFKVLVDPAQVRNGEPHKFDEIGWFSIDALPTPLHSQIPTMLEKYKERL